MSLLQPQSVTSLLPFDFSSEAWNWLLPVAPDVAVLGARAPSPAPTGWAPNNHSWPPQCRAFAYCHPETSPSKANRSSTKTSPLQPEPAHRLQEQPCLLKEPPEVVSDPGNALLWTF